MATRQTTPISNPVVLAPTNSLKRPLSEDADSDSPDSKKIKLQAKDRKRRKKKKKKTPVVLPLDLPASAHVTPTSSPSRPLIFPPTPNPTKSSTNPDKGKRKATSAPPAPAIQVQVESEARETELGAQATEHATELPQETDATSGTIAKLTDELSVQSALVKKHETTLTQLNQSLTCQVCLDLLHKPYALAPCGHVACYSCLVAWFTSEPEENFGLPRKKTCPHCRATIKERPVEVWSIKDMVAALVKSGLVNGLSAGPAPPPVLPGPPQPAGAATPPDPWHNIFRYPHRHPRIHPPPVNGGEPPSVEDMGMLDMEDGGVYRCLDCMHEIWDGVCTACQRVYPGHHHEGFEEGEMFDDSDGEDPIFWPPFPHMHPAADYDGPIPLPNQWWAREDSDSDVERSTIDAEDGYDSFIDDDDDGAPRAAAIIEINDSDSDGHGSSPPQPIRGRRAAPATRLITLGSSDDERDDGAVVVHSRRRRAGNRIASPASESEVIVVSDDDEHTPRRRGSSRARIARHISPDDEEEGQGDYADHGFSDDESSTASSTYGERARRYARFGVAFQAADLVHLMRQFEDAGPDEDSEDEHRRSDYEDGW
ncbi:hypothetical protein DFH07DRAFT_811611 [Mycena maculata]|uniref:RING-type domain-containing protein n=1 Tax=Mycena maculata TaxID=230809 RepID=A0AAD7JIG2_9AGAR|nr:hypothetical protein DFH07DRAFT_811611 [Mycena maculata]